MGRSGLADLSDGELAAFAQLEQGGWLGEIFRRYERRLPGSVSGAIRVFPPGSIRWHDTPASTLRRRRRYPHGVIDADVDLPTTRSEEVPDDAFGISVLACRTALALQRLPVAQRDVVLLRLGQARAIRGARIPDHRAGTPVRASIAGAAQMFRNAVAWAL